MVNLPLLFEGHKFILTIMKKIVLVRFLFLMMLLSAATVVGAQEFVKEIPVTTGNYGLYAGGQASTNGLGVNLGYIFGPKLTLRTGVESLNFSKSFSFDENDISYQADLNYKTGGVFLIADYYFTSRMCFSVGAAFNSFNPQVTGQAASDLAYGDITIPAAEVGQFNVGIEPSMDISPYAGAGYRHFLGKNKKVVYTFETGVYYMGAPQFNIEATGLLSPTADPAHGQTEYMEKQFESYKIYPVVKLNIAFKLF
jgi:hypothetical protein